MSSGMPGHAPNAGALWLENIAGVLLALKAVPAAPPVPKPAAEEPPPNPDVSAAALNPNPGDGAAPRKLTADAPPNVGAAMGGCPPKADAAT